MLLSLTPVTYQTDNAGFPTNHPRCLCLMFLQCEGENNDFCLVALLCHIYQVVSRVTGEEEREMEVNSELSGNCMSLFHLKAASQNLAHSLFQPQGSWTAQGPWVRVQHRLGYCKIDRGQEV